MPAFVILIANLVQDFNTLSTLGKKLPFFLLSIFIIIIFSYALVEAIVGHELSLQKREQEMSCYQTFTVRSKEKNQTFTSGMNGEHMSKMRI